MTSYEIAIAMYERALQIFAGYAGYTREAPVESAMTEILNEAERLALPGERIPTAADLPLLVSIMGHLHHQQKVGFYRPQVIGPEAIMPETTQPTNLAPVYTALWQEFARERQQLITTQQSALVQEANLHALLQRYTWAIPAPLLDTDRCAITDISLYDYARISAALAVCLQQPTKAATAILIGGDISGVQEWLYTFGSTGAARSLRGRSFYLQLLSEVIAFYVLARLQLPMSNLLYAGGGNFYVLAPAQLAPVLSEIRQEISRKLLKMHDGALYVALTSAPIHRAMLLGEDGKQVTDAWGAVSRQLNQQKSRRFTELTNSEMASVIGSGMGWSGKPEHTCAVCRRMILPNERAEPVENEPEKYTCAQCKSFRELGNALRDAEFLVISQLVTSQREEESSQTVTDWLQGLRQFGYDVQLVSLSQEQRKDPSHREPPKNYEMMRIYFWQEQTPTLNQFPGNPDRLRTVWSYRPLAQCVPLVDDPAEGGWRIANFDELKSDGIARWGVLRMDVDSLGGIFREGITGRHSNDASALRQTSFSRLVGVSGLLRLFFEGYVPKLADKYNACEPRMYLMYAGGDDLFVVGGWSDLPNLAQEIRREFDRFVCGNPKVTISGGVAIAPDKKYPLYQLAAEAGDAEHQAKHYRPQKDAFCFLDQPMAWGDEYNPIKTYVDQIVGWLPAERKGNTEPARAILPRSFLNTLRAIDATWRAWRENERGEHTDRGIQPRYHHPDKALYLGPWLWNLIYNLHRAAGRSGRSEVKQGVQGLITYITGGGIKSLGLIARWAELLTRNTD